MSAKIARGGQAKGKSRSKAPARKPARKQAPPPGMLDALPFAPDVVRRVSWMLFLLVMLALGVAVAVAMKVPQIVGVAVGEGIGEAGFAVKRVEIKGLNRMERLPVYTVALDQQSMAMPLVDIEGTRAKLLRFGWVEEARVSRRWPDTLVVDVVERRPAAIWQHNQQLDLIDHDGVVLERVKMEAMPDLPLVIGPAANRQAGALNRLLGAAPQVKPLLAGATWIGARRWDLRFQSGETLALPEGQEKAAKALVHFARMDKQVGLLGRGMVRFDMRVPGKLIVRVSDQPGMEVPAVEPPPPPPPPVQPTGPIDATKTI